MKGLHDHTIDAKGRVSIPAVFRAELQTRDDRPPVLSPILATPALALYSADQWQEIEDRIDSMSQVQRAVQQIRRLVIANAVDAPIDGQGRILVPPRLRTKAGLEREVVIAGAGKRIEIWARTRWDENENEIESGEEAAALAAQLAEQGL